MSDRVEIVIGIDDTEVNTKIDATAAKADKVVADWRRDRREIEREIRITLNSISQVISVMRQAISTFGAVLNPWYNALLGLVASTISTLVAIGLAFASNPATGAWAPVIFGAAAILSTFQTAKLAVDFATITAQVAQSEMKLAALQGRSPSGVSHAFGGGRF